MLPLINLVFLLMILFMLIGAVATPAPFALDPATSTALPPAGADGDTLWVAADGRLGWRGRVLAQGELATLARAWRAQSLLAGLTIRADREAEAAEVVRLLEILREAGVTRTELRLAAER